MKNRRRRWTIIAEVLRSQGISPTAGAEIGVWKAQCTTSLLGAFPNLKLWGIDPYRAFTQKDYCCRRSDSWTQDRWDELFEAVKEGLHPYGDRVVLLRTTSKKAVQGVPSSLDFVFIDGNHAEEYVAQDIELWEPKISSGGLLFGHDYGSGFHRGVKRAVDRLAQEKGRELHVDPDDGVWWWRVVR